MFNHECSIMEYWLCDATQMSQRVEEMSQCFDITVVTLKVKVLANKAPWHEWTVHVMSFNHQSEIEACQLGSCNSVHIAASAVPHKITYKSIMCLQSILMPRTYVKTKGQQAWNKLPHQVQVTIQKPSGLITTCTGSNIFWYHNAQHSLSFFSCILSWFLLEFATLYVASFITTQQGITSCSSHVGEEGHDCLCIE